MHLLSAANLILPCKIMYPRGTHQHKMQLHYPCTCYEKEIEHIKRRAIFFYLSCHKVLASASLNVPGGPYPSRRR